MSKSFLSNSLENQFLIAMPQMLDPFFAHTVTYLWRHTEEGALGIVINRPMRASIADIFNELDIHCPLADQPFTRYKVLAGGPVERDKGFIIHDTLADWESSINVTDELAVCTSREMLERIAEGTGPKNYLIALGCAGWEAGQLEQEITANAWLTTPANLELIFSRDYEKKARAAASILGIDLNQISPDAGHS